MADISEQIESAKETITEPLPTPPALDEKRAEPKELLERLNWGEPALTILDVRDRKAFNQERITGSMLMSVDHLPQAAEEQLEHNRDIYLYGDSDESAAQAAQQLRQSGFENVAQINGGLGGWKKIGGPTEGVEAFSSPAEASVD